MAEAAQDAVDMYNEAEMIEEAYKVLSVGGANGQVATPTIFFRLLSVV